MTKDGIARRDTFIPLGTVDTTYSHQTYALSTSPVTLSIPMQASGILVQALTQNARFTLDGTAPSTSKGYQLKAGDPPLFIGIDKGMVLKFCAETAGAILEYDYGTD